jgi:hypothetical protein
MNNAMGLILSTKKKNLEVQTPALSKKKFNRLGSVG